MPESMTEGVVELTSDEQFRSAFPVLRELRTHLDEGTYLRMLESMRALGYRMFALIEQDEIVAVAGVRIGVNFYYFRYLWVFDLITTEGARSRGHGARLLTALEDVARAEGCDTIALASAVHRIDAHRFYEERMDYERVSYTFVKKLV